ncbi:gliding motility-associated C-terminal domain-containing protein [Flavobacterium sp.]|uniref:gliding motility-associated C-terminal domain-containing protein n=1 Tax=Flavobacterium sp. TaxID=239 RepID=UPI0025E758C3|nr:gliding motility-associated C-terminal domain-containing protein [Flavobacterium sp.]
MEPTFTRLARLFVSLLFLCSLGLYSQIGPGIAPVNLPSGGFTIDGSLLSNSTNGDWVDGTGSGGFVLANSGTPLNTKTTYHLYDEYDSGTDNIFGGGDKVSDNPNSMTWVNGTSNNKTDMNNALIHFTTDSNGNVWFVFAADRLSNSGNAYIDFEFLQDQLTKTATGFSTTASNSTGGRTEGDFLLTVYFESGVAKFDIQRWTLVSGVWQYTTYYSTLPVNSVYAAGNSSIISVPYSAFGTNSYPENTFIESAVNLTEVLSAIDPCASLKIKTIFVKSKTSTAPSASIKDFFEPLPVTNLTLGSADAGDDDTVCSGGSYKLQGAAVPSSNYSVVSTTWSVISGNATIDTPSSLDSYVTINGGSATLRLTVETHPSNGIGAHCVVYDEVTITTIPSPSCLITGTDGPICPSTESSFSAPSSASYLWDISGNGTISGSTTSQTVTLTTGSTCNASFTLTLNTTDANGCTSTCTKTVVVNDTTAPIVTTSSGALDHNIQCNNTAAIASALTEAPTATDNCSTTPTIHLVSDVTTPTTNCANGYSRVRTWNFSDGCGNTSSNFVQTITVIDNTAPTWTTAVGSLNTTVECSDTQALADAQNLFPIASDNCDADLSNIVKVAGTFVASATCTNAGTYTNMWTVTDDCGNVSETFTQTINVIDTTVPTWTTTVGSLNTTVECSDIQALADAQNLFPIATDNCDADLSNNVKVSGTFVASATCTNAGTYTNMWTVTDDCGNVSETFTQTINVIDTTVPTWTTTVGSLNTTVECSDIQALADAQNLFPIATDNCDADLSNNVKVSGTFVASATCANAGTYTNTWTVTDDCGNVSETFTQVINVIDTTVPTWTTAVGSLNTTIECNDTQALANAQNLFPIASDNCDADLSNNVKVSGTFVASATCTNAGTYTNTWTVTDACGNSSETFTQVINVIDTTVPTWTTAVGSLNTTVECNDTQALTNAQNLFPIATDNCDADLSNIVKVAGTFVASATCANAGTYTNTWAITDDCGNSSETFTQVINVIDNTAPTWTTAVGSLNTTVECSDTQALANAQNLFPVATDNCDADLSNIVKVAGTFVASATCANAGTYTNTWTVTDACGNVSETFKQTITIQDTTVPDIATKATDIIVECDGQGNQNAIANWLANNGGAIAFDNCSEIIWTNNFNSIANDCSTAVTVVFTATDTCGNSASTSATFSVQDNTPPVVPVAPTTITVGCASDIPAMIPLTARDNCSGNITVEGTNSIELGDCENTYTINRTWTFTDACNNISSTSQIIHVIDTTPPTIAPLPELSTIACPNTPVFTQAIATDECGSNVNLTFKDVKTEGSCAGSYSITRNWTATDMCGNSTTASQTINVEDKVAPVIASLPEPTTITCPNSPVFAFATATDECGSDFNLTFKDVKTEGSCAGSYSITRTWTATDTCGNSSTASQTINVEDKIGPITTSEFNSNVTANCDAIPVKPELVFVDACSAINSTIFTETISNQTTDSYIINRKWSVSDTCGNTSEFIQTVNVTIANSLITLTGSVCNDGETTSIDLTSLFPTGTPTTGTWTDFSNTGKLEGNNFNAATLAVGDYIFEYAINDANCPRSIRITVTVTTDCGGIVLPCGTIVVHNAFSPNGDGINEKFVIDNINDTNCYPDNTVEIYNRWGVLVYSTKGYNNTTNAFDGISIGQSAVSQSSGLPAGTYFYILTYTSFDNNNTIQNNKKVGYLFLTK